MIVRTRMAPSPTGEFHIGSLRTLLYNWAWARKNAGKFIIRIEDTDRKRLVEGAEERILQVIKDYGLSWDEGPDIGGPYAPYRQSERLPIYKEWVRKLIEKGNAYYCFCSEERLEKVRQEKKKKGLIPKYDRHCLGLSPSEVKEKIKKGPYVVRLKVPDNQVVVFEDTVRGEIKTNTNNLDDQILLKSDGFPTYHLAVVVDDILMKISHVIRGEEWLPSTPKHILLYEAFGHKPPIFTHVTVILNPSGKGKLSKRQGGVSARYFLDQGYLPEAVLNFLMLLGWAPKDNREIFSLEEFVKVFDLNGLQLSSPTFNREKLDWFNKYYIRNKDDAELAKLLIPFAPEGADENLIRAITPLIKERIAKLSDFSTIAGFFFVKPDVDSKLLGPNYREHLSKAFEALSSIGQPSFPGQGGWKIETINETLLKVVEDNNFKTGEFFMDLRIAITGSKVTPPINESLVILGRNETLERLKRVLVS